MVVVVVDEDEEEDPEDEPEEEDPEAEEADEVLNRLSTTPEVAEPETEEDMLNPLPNDYVSSKIYQHESGTTAARVPPEIYLFKTI